MNFTTPNLAHFPPALGEYIRLCLDETGSITLERRGLLDRAAAILVGMISTRGSADMVHICTHNSRRSQFCQAWGAIAAIAYNVNGLNVFSCGTEVTSCNPRTVAALQRAQVPIEAINDGINPRYRIQLHASARTIELYSKDFSDKSLPKGGYLAWMCCSQADQACPVLPNIVSRLPISYEDPGASDSTPDELDVYDARCRQIAVELLHVVRRVSSYKPK